MPDLNKIQKLVYKVIQDNPGCQNDDADLIAAVWRYEGWSDNRGLEQNIAVVTRSETITRRRRELFNMGMIEYSPKALQSRTKAFKNERNLHSDHEQKVAAIVKPVYIEMTNKNGERVMQLL
jgi:hypothetical protein